MIKPKLKITYQFVLNITTTKPNWATPPSATALSQLILHSPTRGWGYVGYDGWDAKSFIIAFTLQPRYFQQKVGRKKTLAYLFSISLGFWNCALFDY